MDYEAASKFVHDYLNSHLPDSLYYHGPSHTDAVVKASMDIASSESLDERELLLLKTAALFHDLGFAVRYKANECIACEMAASFLPRWGYSDDDIALIQTMIKATEMPQNPKNNKLAMILCDADLAYLGGPDYYSVSNMFRAELAARDIVFSDMDWLEFQLKFLKAHSYFTASARASLEPRKHSYIAELELRLKQLNEK